MKARLALVIGLAITLIWLAAAFGTAALLRREVDEVLDSALAETGQRILQLAVIDILGREETDASQRLAALREHEEYFTYVVRNDQGEVLLKSHGADETLFPPFEAPGLRNAGNVRIYSDGAVQNSITIAIAEPLAHREEMAREMLIGLSLPLVAVIPLSLLAIMLGVGLAFGSIGKLRQAMAQRGVRDLSPVDIGPMPSELAPIARSINHLLGRLSAAFEAERSFAANAAHELRTPLAGAIAQAQRLRRETDDEAAATRAGEIEATLKRLARISEKLMQMARAEGGRLRLDQTMDLRAVLSLVAGDFQRMPGANELALSLGSEPVVSDLDPDAFAILARNLIENALRYAHAGTTVCVSFNERDGLRVENAADPIPAEIMARLATRFIRAGSEGEGSGLGLAIVSTILDRIGGRLDLLLVDEGAGQRFIAHAHFPLQIAP